MICRYKNEHSLSLPHGNTSIGRCVTRQLRHVKRPKINHSTHRNVHCSWLMLVIFYFSAYSTINAPKARRELWPIKGYTQLIRPP